MRFSHTPAVAALAAAIPLVLAQTSTDCDPTKKTCPADTGLNAGTFVSDFTQGAGANASWSAAAYTTINYASDGAEFIIAKEGQAPTVQTDFYIFFGRVEVTMKAAAGQGIISSIVLESDDLDEIDWEFIGGNTTTVETNFFGKANTTAYDRAIYYPVDNPQSTFHTYTVDWTAERLQFIIDGAIVRTLLYTDPLTNGGNNYPQTPMRVKLGNWAAGAAGQPEGTVEWAGGATDFSQAPFTMVVSKVAITNYNPGSTYTYGDMTGSYESIKIDGSSSSVSGGNSSASGSSSSSATLSTVTTAPASSHSVAPIVNNSGAIVSTTVQGSSYTTGTATPSAASTEVSAQPSASGPTGTSSGAAATASTGAASTNSVFTTFSLFSIALGFFML